MVWLQLARARIDKDAKEERNRRIWSAWLSCRTVDKIAEAENISKSQQTQATHGLQLSQADKRDMARRIYHATPERERDAKKQLLASILSVSERTVRDWLSRIDKDAKEARDKKIFDMWLACKTNKTIGAAVGLSEEAVRQITQEMADLPKLGKTDISAAEHATDFTPPIYNIWKLQEKTDGKEARHKNSEEHGKPEQNQERVTRAHRGVGRQDGAKL